VSRETKSGLSATWWGTTALICLVAAIVALARGDWFVGAFFVAAGIWPAARTVRRVREGNL